MSIFNEGPGASQSSEAELAALAKAEPELAEAPPPAPEPEPPAPAQEAAPTAPTPADGQEQPAAPEPAPAAPNPSAIARLSEENRHYKQQLTQMQGQLEAMQRMLHPPSPSQQQPQPGQQQEEPPDPEADPIGALRYERQARLAIQNHLQGLMVQQNVERATVADAQQFLAKTPDFGQAYAHLFASRVGQLRLTGATDQQIAAQVRQEEFGLTLQALRQGKSPAQALYEMAKTYGYTPPAPKPAPAPAAPDPTLQEARAKAAVSLSDGGKPEKGGELSLDDILNLRGAAQESALKAWEKRNTGKQSIFRE